MAAANTITISNRTQTVAIAALQEATFSITFLAAIPSLIFLGKDRLTSFTTA